MNLKLKRLVRTPASEQYALFDLDRSDADGMPITIGKLDLHYTGEGMYGTLLFWDERIRTMAEGTRRTFVRALLNDLAQPMGVPNEFVVEFFAPTLDLYEVIHNIGLDDDAEEVEGIDDDLDEDLDDDLDEDVLDAGESLAIEEIDADDLYEAIDEEAVEDN